MSDYSRKRNSLLPKRKQQEVPVKPEKEIKIGDITEDGYKVCHLYEDGRVLLSNKDGTKVIHKSDIK
jgi:hypothetical protein